MPEDASLSIILGRPFLNTAEAHIDCPQEKVTFNINGESHTEYFPEKKLIQRVSMYD